MNKLKNFLNSKPLIQLMDRSCILVDRLCDACSFCIKLLFWHYSLNCRHYNNWELTLEKENSISLNQLYNNEVINNISSFGSNSEQNVPHLQNGKSTRIAMCLNKIAH